MILLSGDFHGNQMNEMVTLNTKNIKKFCNENNVNEEDIKYHIILGDTGFLWPKGEKQDKFNLKFFESKNFITLGILGNHDNYDAIEKLPLVDIGIGNPVWKLTDFFYFLPRGKIYTIEGNKILALGGGLSIDKYYRMEGVSWWKKEYWSYTEEHNLYEYLKDIDEVDYVVSHTGTSESMELLRAFMSLDKYDDKTILINNYVASKVKFKKWFHGHYHMPVENDKYCCLYKNLGVIKNDS